MTMHPAVAGAPLAHRGKHPLTVQRCSIAAGWQT
jgi:hypothetical protein